MLWSRVRTLQRLIDEPWQGRHQRYHQADPQLFGIRSFPISILMNWSCPIFFHVKSVAIPGLALDQGGSVSASELLAMLVMMKQQNTWIEMASQGSYRRVPDGWVHFSHWLHLNPEVDHFRPWMRIVTRCRTIQPLLRGFCTKHLLVPAKIPHSRGAVFHFRTCAETPRLCYPLRSTPQRMQRYFPILLLCA